ncbi:MAG: hypothetical protein DHS20C01_25670 [marine bacterium B5-7]|nr:MAG: hypothetical protein DHS20C01_25670 [marine bacterium B5-7]
MLEDHIKPQLNIRTRSPATPELHGNTPLYKRVPSRDEDGKPLSDFMMLIPGLRNLGRVLFNDRVAGIQAVINSHREVVFVDLNVPINILWISLKPRIGLISQIAGEIQHRIPEALLIAPDHRFASKG